MEYEDRRKRRRYSRELKAQIVAECEVPGASVARVAMAHGVNANIVHGWRQLAREGARQVATVPARASQVFVPVKLTPPPPASWPSNAPAPIVVELQRGPLTLRVSWPSSAVAEFAAWTQELLR
jgi:transposase